MSTAAPTADACLASAATDPNGAQTIRIVGLFAILCSSAVGVWLPWFTSARGLRTATFFGTSFAAGIVLATAFVHILPDGEAAFTNPCLGFSGTYPWAAAIAGGSVLVVFVIELLLKRSLLAKLELVGGTAPPPAGPADFKPLAGAGRPAADPEAGAIVTAGSPAVDDEKRRMVLTENRLAASMLELGIVFHSMFVGIDLGINTNVSSARALLIALLFHQGFEGLALGASLVRAECDFRKFTILALIFCFVTPVGVAIGLGLGSSYNDNGKVALGFQGAFSSVSTGILIYNGLVDLIVPIFMGSDEHALPPRVKKSTPLLLLSLLCCFAGYCLMALIGKWA